MLRSLIVVRHAQPNQAGERPGTWALSSDGIAQAERLGSVLRRAVHGGPTAVVSSTEPKAIKTAEALGLGGVRHDDRLGEVARPWYEDEGSFRTEALRYLSGEAVAGWESRDDAAARFGTAISELDGHCVVVSHGTIMSAWLSRHVSDLDAPDFWDHLEMPDAWIVDLGDRSARRIADHGST